jgi:hypothetical protein
MPLPAHLRRRKPRDPLAGQVLGVYRGPQRVSEPPTLTAYRLRLLKAIAAGEVKLGTGSYTGAFRWHCSGGAHSTVTKAVTPFIRCGWAVAVGKHLELTEAGRAQLPRTEEAS